MPRPGSAPPGSRIWIYAPLFVAWQVCAFPLYRAEWSGIQLAAELRHQSDDDRKAYADGAIYAVLKEAQILVSPEARVLFVNPATGPRGDYYGQKATYYLWPRRIEFVAPANLSAESVARVDAVIVFDPERTPADTLLLLDRQPSLTKAFESFRDRPSVTAWGFESARGRSYEAIFLRNP